MYLDNPDGITWRVKKVLAVALGGGEQGAGRRDQGTGGLPEVSDEEALKRGLEYIGSVDNLEKRERMTTVFKLYMEGKNTKEQVHDIVKIAGATAFPHRANLLCEHLLETVATD